MQLPRQESEPHHLNDANDLSRSFEGLLPRSKDDVAHFLFEAAYALGEREADLARELGVSRATLSGWKSRGTIPPSHLKWFEAEYPLAVLSARAPRQHEGFRHAGIELALALFHETDFDPFGVAASDRQLKIERCFQHLGGLSRLALFVMHRAPTTLHPIDGSNVALLMSLARQAAPRMGFR